MEESSKNGSKKVDAMTLIKEGKSSSGSFQLRELPNSGVGMICSFGVRGRCPAPAKALVICECQGWGVVSTGAIVNLASADNFVALLVG